MTEENDSLHDDQRWNYLWNNPDLNKRKAFRPVSYTHLTLPTTPYV